jgi:hypothetical protein
VVKNLFKTVIADVLLLTAEYFVLQDQGRRTAYAASLHSACPVPCGYSTSYAYGILTQFFTMMGQGVSLTSPPTLDWTQVLVVLLIIVNGWFLYSLFGRKVTDTKGPDWQTSADS